jgi:hypothetical protein
MAIVELLFANERLRIKQTIQKVTVPENARIPIISS